MVTVSLTADSRAWGDATLSCSTSTSSESAEQANRSGWKKSTSAPRSRPSQRSALSHESTVSSSDTEVVRNHKKSARLSSEPHALQLGLTAEQVEPWQRFPYLNYGYRRGGTYLQCLLSLFSLHNETVNAWTTLLSVVMGVVLFFDTVSSLRCSWIDFSPFLLAWAGQTLHGPLSVGYHLFMCKSPVVANRWRKLDLSFILVLNTCATYALSYFTFGLWFTLVWTSLVASAAALGIRNIAALQPKQQLDRRRILGMIGLTCLGYYIPLTLRGLAALALQRKVWPELGIALVVLGCHFTGGLVYATHWPQRHFLGVFDLGGFSHNLMHIFCFTAYNCAYPYLSYLYSQRGEWEAATSGALAWASWGDAASGAAAR
ncbi:hypothetical protein HYH03_001929 [Edaphochlamys debaryana]|uniref:Uncharacterized protein n=1 Tax=Edaphochlamys debaryana TaxID=47281 RepID=A0A835YCF4_9CHLO|nr:hypothetical protein HYH03_001929 [Edaphochlamys debaryana]|eukprot:KAG2500355.1 hypothetical protein HYH03_001929 [Edaphochlamys debaryana]